MTSAYEKVYRKMSLQHIDFVKEKSLQVASNYGKMYRRMSLQNINLLQENQVPPHMREIAILSGYRSPRSSALQCALSVFIATNETLNFWTHFIPTLYFLWQLVMLWDLLKVISDPYTWPFTVYMITICLYPLISALAHTFFSTSEMARYIWFFLDYGALNLYGYGAGLLYKAYTFPTELNRTVFGMYFMEFLVFLCILGTVSACYSRFVTHLGLVKLLRLGGFSLPWIWDAIPVVYRLSLSNDLKTSAAEHYLFSFFFSFLIGFFYASHLPERLAPGKFDFLGNSHQLLHICGILATHHQMSGALIDMEHRRAKLFDQHAILPDFWSIQISVSLVVTIIAIILAFIERARNHKKLC